jgi:hypothetical protein
MPALMVTCLHDAHKHAHRVVIQLSVIQMSHYLKEEGQLGQTYLTGLADPIQASKLNPAWQEQVSRHVLACDEACRRKGHTWNRSTKQNTRAPRDEGELRTPSSIQAMIMTALYWRSLHT